MISLRHFSFALLFFAAATARCEQAGSIDSAFNAGAGASAAIESIAIYPDNRVLAAGRFDTWSGQPAARIVRLLANGGRDETFAAPPGIGVLSPVRIWLQADGKILIAGDFTSIGGMARSNFARLLENGEVDPAFIADTDANVADALPLADGKVLIAGPFTTVNGVPRSRVALLNADGSADAAFDPPISAGFARSVARLPNSQLLVAGFSASPINGLVRLNPDGSLDPGLNLGNRAFSANRAFPDADGNFILDATFNPSRILANDAIDGKFANGTGTTLVTLSAVQNDGRILAVGGSLRDATGAASRMVRLFNDGKIDPSFRTSLSAAPAATAIRPDGKIIVAGMFTLEAAPIHTVLALHGNDTSAPAEILWSASDLGAVHNGFVTLKAIRQGNFGEAASATWSASFTAADAEVTPASGSLQFEPGQRVADVRLSLSSRPEVATEIRVDLANFTGAVAGGNPRVTLYLANQSGAVQFNAATYSGEEVTGRTLIGLRRTGALDRSVAIRWRAIGEAPARDLSPTSGYVSFPAGNANASAIFNINDDRDVEADRDYLIEIASDYPDWTIDGATQIALHVSENDLPGLPGPGADGNVFRLAPLSDGGMLMAGQFTFVNGLERRRLARLTAYSRLVDSFQAPEVILNSAGIGFICEQTDGKFLVFGNHIGANGQSLDVVRLNANGTTDATFNGENLPPVSQGADPGGAWLLFGSSANRAVDGVYQGSIVRTDRSGRLDETFATFTAGWGTPAIIPLANGQFYASGNIVASTSAYRAGQPLPVPFRAGIIRLFADGTIDPAFNVVVPGANVATTNLTAGPSRVRVDQRGRLYAAGTFATLNGISVPGFARLNSSGELDALYNDTLKQTLPAGRALDFAVTAEGRAVLYYEATPRLYQLHFVDENGVIQRSTTIASGVAPGLQLAATSEGRFVLSGDFLTIFSQSRYRYAWFNADGTLRADPSPVIEQITRGGGRSALRITSRQTGAVPLKKSGNLVEWHPLRDIQLVLGEQFIEIDDEGPVSFYKLAP